MAPPPPLGRPLAALPCLHRPLVVAAAYLRLTCTPEGFIPRSPPPGSLILEATASGWSHDPSAPPPAPPCGELDAALWRALLLELRDAGPLLPRLPRLDLASRAAVAGGFLLTCPVLLSGHVSPFLQLQAAIVVGFLVSQIVIRTHRDRFNAALPRIVARYAQRFYRSGLRLAVRKSNAGPDYLIVSPCVYVPPVGGRSSGEPPAPPPAVAIAQGLPVVMGMVTSGGAALSADAGGTPSREGPVDAPIVQGQRIHCDVLPATGVVHAERRLGARVRI